MSAFPDPYAGMSADELDRYFADLFAGRRVIVDWPIDDDDSEEDEE